MMAGSVVRKLYNFIVGQLKTVRRNYNVLERSEKILKSDKLPAAPRHPGTAKKFECIVKDRPDVSEHISKTSPDLLDRLKSVKVQSMDSEQVRSETVRELPQKRGAYQMPNFGYEEPKVTPQGKCSLRHALEFITNNQNDPQTWTNEFVADKYKMEVADVEHVTKNFKAFEIVFATGKKNKVTQNTLDTLGVNKVKKLPFYERHKKSTDNVEADSSEKAK